MAHQRNAGTVDGKEEIDLIQSWSISPSKVELFLILVENDLNSLYLLVNDSTHDNYLDNREFHIAACHMPYAERETWKHIAGHGVGTWSDD